ncbi:hypothetical protein F4823DRAFT_562499 [Ustulina deusta]|nr:hypothetical protein F4823DRAFT_562499 [Ustulina deusta]
MTGCVLLHLAGSPPAALPPYQLVPTRTRSAQNSVFFEGFENPHRSLIEACVETHTKSGHSPNLALPFLPYYYCPLKANFWTLDVWAVVEDGPACHPLENRTAEYCLSVALLLARDKFSSVIP